MTRMSRLWRWDLEATTRNWFQRDRSSTTSSSSSSFTSPWSSWVRPTHLFCERSQFLLYFSVFWRKKLFWANSGISIFDPGQPFPEIILISPDLGNIPRIPRKEHTDYPLKVPLAAQCYKIYLFIIFLGFVSTMMPRKWGCGYALIFVRLVNLIDPQWNFCSDWPGSQQN